MSDDELRFFFVFACYEGYDGMIEWVERCMLHRALWIQRCGSIDCIFGIEDGAVFVHDITWKTTTITTLQSVNPFRAIPSGLATV